MKYFKILVMIIAVISLTAINGYSHETTCVSVVGSKNTGKCKVVAGHGTKCEAGGCGGWFQKRCQCNGSAPSIEPPVT